MKREECIVWSYGSRNDPLKVNGHESKIRAVSMVVCISLAPRSCMDASCVSLGNPWESDTKKGFICKRIVRGNAC